MKKTIIFLSTAALLFTTTLQSCIGSFALTKKVFEWNKGMGDKWTQELIFIVFSIFQVYEVAVVIDALILNSIEFWTGSNPMAMKEGEKETQTVKGNDGLTYQITATKNKFHILQMDGADKGKESSFIFNPEELAWSFNNGEETVQLAKINLNEDGSFKNYSLYYNDNSFVSVEAGLSKAELTDVYQANQPSFAMSK